MTPRFTSSNRKLRTTAIAAMVAVSTVFTGVTPAFAADTVTNANSAKGAADGTRAAGLNDADGSKLPKGTVKSEAELRDATDNVAKQIKEFGRTADKNAFAEVFAKFRTATAGHENPLNDTEEGALQALQARYDAITAVLKTAAQNQADASASVASALTADDNASKAFNDVMDDFFTLSNAERIRVNTLVYWVNKENKTALPDIQYLATDDGTFTVVDGKDADGNNINVTVKTEKGKVTPDAALSFLWQVKAHKDNLRDISADRSEGDFVTREYTKRIETLYKDSFVAPAIAQFDASQEALVKAQKTDVISMQMFMDRSRAQVLVLRLLQAKYGVYVRMGQLYENQVLTSEGKSVITAYLEALYGEGIDQQADKNIDDALKNEFVRLDEADRQAKALYDGWKADLGNSPYLNVKLTEKEKKERSDYREDQERKAYEGYIESEARRTYLDIDSDRYWQNAIETAQLKDKAAFGKSAEVMDPPTVDPVGPVVTPPNNNNNNNPGTQPGNSKPAHPDDEFPFVPLAVAGVVIAIIAALAAHFPVLLAALPKI